ncbi:MAG: translation elongation factor Ts [Mariprofundaceae bacterium]
MAQITAADVKKLRELSGAGMMDCKKALTEVDGNLDAAVDFLRKKGLSAAGKKEGRVAAEGVVLAKANGSTGVLLELNAETDFVSKNDQFNTFANTVADLILDKKPADVEALNALSFDAEHTVEQALSQLIATIGENMNIRRFAVADVAGVASAYVHAGGKIGVLIGIEGNTSDELSSLARSVAMHVAASNPQAISRDDVDAAAVERERAVLSERAIASGKPEAIVDKIVTGQLNKFYSEICLLEQDFVMDTDVTVGKAISNVQSDAKLVSMMRFQLGEGIEKKEEDFAAEVAAQVNG